jgi:phospholipid/cholesterol/gamma-HCH transport system ATP-binding protein
MEDNAIKPIAKSALAAVGLPNNEHFLKNINSDLTGSMAKRLAIARAKSMGPYVFFYDEPTTVLAKQLC